MVKALCLGFHKDLQTAVGNRAGSNPAALIFFASFCWHIHIFIFASPKVRHCFSHQFLVRGCLSITWLFMGHLRGSVPAPKVSGLGSMANLSEGSCDRPLEIVILYIPDILDYWLLSRTF